MRPVVMPTACELDGLSLLKEYTVVMQVSSNKVARAENASLRSELGGLRSQLSETSKQLEAERATSEALPSYEQVDHSVACCRNPAFFRSRWL